MQSRPAAVTSLQAERYRDALRARRAGTALRIRFLVLAGIVVVILVAVSIGVGQSSTTIPQLWDALITGRKGTAHTILFEQRIPRTALAVMAGVGLAIAGSLMQALTRNPLADPGILGVNAGAAFAVTIGIGILGLNSVALWVPAAFFGALVVTLLVFALGTRSAARNGGAVSMTLAGVAIAAVLQGATQGLTLAAPKTFEAVRAWSAGTFVGRGVSAWLWALPCIVVGTIIAIAITRSLNAVALGDEAAAALGVSVTGTRVWGIVAITLLAGGVTAAAGPIAFVGLIVAHVARLVMGADQRWCLAFCAVAGPVLTLVSDVFARFVLWPSEIPVGIVTAFLGAPILLVVVLRSRAVRE